MVAESQTWPRPHIRLNMNDSVFETSTTVAARLAASGIPERKRPRRQSTLPETRRCVFDIQVLEKFATLYTQLWHKPNHFSIPVPAQPASDTREFRELHE